MLEEIIIRILGYAVAKRILGGFIKTTSSNMQQRRGCWDRWGRWGCAIALGIVITIIALGWVIAYGLFIAITYACLALYAGLKYLASNTFIGLEKLFYPGYDVPSVVLWGFWGLIVGAAIQGARELLSVGRKVIGVLVAVAPVLLLGLNGTIKSISLPTPQDIKPTTVQQEPSESKEKPIKTTELKPSRKKQTTTKPIPKRRQPMQTTKRVETNPIKPKEPTRVEKEQNTVTTPLTDPKPSTSPAPIGMVYIPAGGFQMGSNESDDEKPVHTAYTDAFYMDKYEVTNAQYKVFVDANPQWQKSRISSKYHDGDYLKHWSGNTYLNGKANHPVTFVSWYAAMAYAKWTGKRLPTEAEWEKAARGTLIGKKYPWGNSIDSTDANYGKSIGDTTIVGKYVANDYGLYDMAGNVLEWCIDRYDENSYSSSILQNPVTGRNIIALTENFLNVTTERVLRGGSWTALAQNVRVSDRTKGNPTLSYFGIGFRCVKDGTNADRD